MYDYSPHVYELIPLEYRKTVEDLFPSGPSPAGQGPTVRAAENFAGILGIGADYTRLLNTQRSDRDLMQFLGHFQNNLDLLIQKTWVDKSDELRKERLQDRVPEFIADIVRENYRKALKEFSVILGELGRLLFGAQSYRDDFTEYVFRIDTQMGLFWWYGGQIGRFKPVGDGNQPNGAAKETAPRTRANDPCKDGLWAVLLLGICYLTNF
ncbi:hypothetical protein FACS1894137_12300 [Spirochaetia bacterium]|nr:hypothetical protein FACS1894137_12300 [Spirochaetia bacterium]